MTTLKTKLRETANGQANYLNVNEALAQIDQLLQAAALDKDLATPPGSPADGALYIVAASPSGAWTGHATHLAYWLSSVGSWTFVTPLEGWLVHVNDEDQFYKFDGSSWVIFSAAGGGMTNPMTTAGDMIRGGAAGSPTRLGGGANGQAMSMVGGLPAWSSELDSITVTTRLRVTATGANPLGGFINTSLSIPNYTATGFTPALESGEAGRLATTAALTGGLSFNAFTTSSPTALPLFFAAYHGNTAPTSPAITFAAFKHNGTNDRQALASGEIVAQFSNGTNGRLQCLGDGTWRPVGDNTQPLGGASNRWSVVYAGTGTINTSDAREKTEVSPFSSNELEAAKALSREIGTFQWLQSIQAKGADARTHIGLTVQRAIEIMEQHGLDPMRYGFICYDQWEDQFVEHPDEYEQLDVLDEEGNVVGSAQGELIKEAWVEQIKWAGDRYAFRMDQLNLFIARSFHERLAALEGAV